jgi:DNA segregation ATPase FtsK/SpoIIIE-like protein
VLYSAASPLREPEIEASMHSPRPELDLPELRRQLEEILAMVNADHNSAVCIQGTDDGSGPNQENDRSSGGSDLAIANQRPISDLDCKPLLPARAHPAKRDELYNDALLVVTEFGHASPAMLQMWLSIDYTRAITILNRFQAEGVISSKGKVRHKAFSLRRSLDQT